MREGWEEEERGGNNCVEEKRKEEMVRWCGRNGMVEGVIEDEKCDDMKKFER